MKRMICVMMLAAMLLGACAENGPIGHVATEEEMTDVALLDMEGLNPITPEMLNEGEYEVKVDSSSAMFKVVGCTLTVSETGMTARLYMKSTAYSYMFPGKAGEAAETPRDSLIPLKEDGTGLYFELPVDALDSPYVCAALSDRKQAWYPRTLAFRSDSLPLEAFKAENLVTAETLGLEDGEYECEAVLEGKGRTTVQSPAVITVESGECTARIVFSTAKIDYIIVDGEKYTPVSAEDGAAFVIPVAVFDQKIAVTVDSTAIKPATEVAYSVTFFSETLTALDGSPSGE
ncbi:MAG: hypothetical protein IKX84_08600 [Clostridia bacterium]|nr:hypothetical protein [Clostridia bacterium]